MIDLLALVAIAASLIVAAWGFVEAGRDRAPGRALMVALMAVGGIVAVQAIIAAGWLIAGGGPSGGENVVTFVGYLLTVTLAPPAGYVLARMEPTRWGSALVGGACAVVPVLILRLQQVWGG